ncbi:MAG TPA: hypothetical protein VFO16_25030 [Pseudonocardiaceae bacterium]|nr:hypothetical protein [Pseudonocardiaceae bacterium]
MALPSCDGVVAYIGRKALARDIENLRVAVADQPATEVFMTAASPGTIEMFMPSHYYRCTRPRCLAAPTAGIS